MDIMELTTLMKINPKAINVELTIGVNNTIIIIINDIIGNITIFLLLFYIKFVNYNIVYLFLA